MNDSTRPDGSRAFSPDVGALRPELVRYAARLVGDTDAEDVVQIALSKADGAIGGFRGDSTLRTWLYRITTNAAHDWNRARKGAERRTEVDETDVEELWGEEALQERRLVREEMSQCVGEVLQALPESYRVVLALSDCEELSDREVAEVLGASLGAAKVRLHRARSKMKEALEEACCFYRDQENVLCCDRKPKSAREPYPFEAGSRQQVESREIAGSLPREDEDFTMSAVETLPTKQKHLIGIGAAIAAGCEPCTASFVAAAREAGACERGVRFAIESGLDGRTSATAAMSAFADSNYARPELDADFRQGRILLQSLIGVASAMASNTAAVLKERVEAARARGATDDQLRVAAQLGRTAKRGAENGVEAAFRALLDGEPETQTGCGCGSSEGTARTNASRAGSAGPCGCNSAEAPSAAGSAGPCGCSSTEAPSAAGSAGPCGCSSTEAPSAAGSAGPCGCGANGDSDFEVVRIEKTKNGCALCEEYAQAHAHKRTVVMSCEGACLRGEISRQAANHLCHALAPEQTVRLCLGGAFTKDAGQRALVRNAARIVSLEGCATRCASRMMRGHFPDLKPEVFVTDGMCDFDRALFGIESLSPEDVRSLARSVASKIVERL